MSPKTPLRIFVDPSGYQWSNLGDMLMLEAALGRFRLFWPASRITIQCLEPQADPALGTDVHVLDATGSIAWCADVRLFGRPVFSLLRRSVPRMWSRAAEIALLMAGRSSNAVPNYLQAARNADLVCVTGGGHLNDVFARHAYRVLETLELAIEAGATTALVGQGIGPITNLALAARVASVLQRVDFIALREPVTGPAILHSLGIPNERLAVSGDDALPLAYAARPERLGQAIGVNLRTSTYSGIGTSIVSTVAANVHAIVAEHDAEALPVPVSFYADENDLEVASGMIGMPVGDERRIDTKALLEVIGRCRIVVAGSYHAALLALSMGVPVVGVAASPYYRAKFTGLAAQFGPACRVIDASGDFGPGMRAAISDAWMSADDEREKLLEAAARQTENNLEAYRRLCHVVEMRRICPNNHR